MPILMLPGFGKVKLGEIPDQITNGAACFAGINSHPHDSKYQNRKSGRKMLCTQKMPIASIDRYRHH